MTVDDTFRSLLLAANDPDLSPEDREQARSEIVESHIGLVEMAARRYSDRGEPFDDLVQVGSIGLLKAIERFDPERGTQFSTYAVPTIIGEIKRHFRDRGWSVTVPRRLRELTVRMRPARSELHQRLGREPTTAELAEHLSVDPEEVLEAIESAQAYSSLSLETPRDSDGGQLLDTLGKDDKDISIVIARETLRPALEALDPRQRQIIVMRYFGGRTQSQIGEALGISQVQVSRILSRTLEQLRAQMTEEELL